MARSNVKREWPSEHSGSLYLVENISSRFSLAEGERVCSGSCNESTSRRRWADSTLQAVLFIKFMPRCYDHRFLIHWPLAVLRRKHSIKDIQAYIHPGHQTQAIIIAS